MAWVRGEQRDPDKPEPGFYAVKLVKGGPEVGALIDKVGGFWLAKIEEDWVGEPTDDPQLADGVQQIWLFGRRITAQEHDFMLARAAYARHHDPQSPWANPRKPLDLKSIPPIGD